MLKKCLREPLLHFLLIGALLFVGYGLKNDGVSDQNKRIVISKADILRLTLLWEKKRQRPPTKTELHGLIEQQLHEQVLYREALAMGLDKNDSIVRRRLAQKVEFISADLAAMVEPTDAELAEYLNAHPEKFFIPGRIDFVHIYFNTDKRSPTTEADAKNLLSQFKQATLNVDIKTAGDRFMMGQQYNNITDFEISRLFGEAFTKQLSTLAVGRWQGPVYSSYGYHLIRIDKRTATLPAELDAVRSKVHTEWMNEQRSKIDKAFYKSLRQRYEIVIDDAYFQDLVANTK